MGHPGDLAKMNLSGVFIYLFSMQRTLFCLLLCGTQTKDTALETLLVEKYKPMTFQIKFVLMACHSTLVPMI